MDIVLDNIEVRILGCLIEKEIATPEYYPLSLNALTNACNQKSNRRPVLSVSEQEVLRGIEGLRQKGLARDTHSSGSRVTKYVHELLSRFDLSTHEMSILCELMLRGPQTPGELRNNAGRMSPFSNMEEVEGVLKDLIGYDPPLATRLPRETGRKESRYAHLFSPAGTDEQTVPGPGAGPGTHGERAATGAMERMEEEISQLREELEQLRQAFEHFRSQF